jgi:hypothetical protein
MPERSLVLRPARLKLVLYSLGSLAFASTGVSLAAKHGGIKLWFFASFFVLCLVVFLVQLLPGSSYLRLTEEGFDLCTMFRKSARILWQGS